MDDFHLRDGALWCEEVPLEVIAQEVGTPAYVYSTATMLRQVDAFRGALEGLGDPLIAYAVKANPSAGILATLARKAIGADVVSDGELRRARAAGIPASRIVFSGVGKTAAEMRNALREGIFKFNLESVSEAETLSAVASSMDKAAPVALRVNPDVAAETHHKITTGTAQSKFGIPIHEAIAAYDHVAGLPGLSLQGVAVHIGSQITSLAPLERAFARIEALLLALRARGHRPEVVDLGGGLGIPYGPGQPVPPTPEEYGRMVRLRTRGWNVRLVFEPGRLIVGEAGILMSRVIRIKPGPRHPFVIVDAGMNDLMRPALYDSWHEVGAVRPAGATWIADVAGPLCESADMFATARRMDRVGEDDLLYFKTAGAYGASMANSYNSRPLVPEVLVDGSRWAVIRRRIDVDAMIASETVPDWVREHR